jgi:competence protein ComEA
MVGVHIKESLKLGVNKHDEVDRIHKQELTRKMEAQLMKRIKLTKATCLVLVVLFLFPIGISSAADEAKETGKTVNINTATAEDFVKNVPKMTPELAEAIVEYREENGDFTVLEELLQVEGFSRGYLRKVKDFLLLEGLGGDECTC